MDCLTGYFTKYFKSINKFDLFLSFCTWKVLGISANSNFWSIFSFIKQQTSTKYHKKSGWYCRGSWEGKKKRRPLFRTKHFNLMRNFFEPISGQIRKICHFFLYQNLCVHIISCCLICYNMLHYKKVKITQNTTFCLFCGSFEIWHKEIELETIITRYSLK